MNQKQPSTTTSVQKSEPWAQQIPYLQDVMGQAQGLSKIPLRYFPGQTVAPFSAETEQALAAQMARATGGNVATNAGVGELGKTLGGQYLGSGNRYFSQMVAAANRPVIDQFSNQVLPALDAQASMAGRYGSGMARAQRSDATRALTDAISENAGRLAYQNYGDERGNMMRAITYAPQYAQQDLANLSLMRDVGETRENLAQQQIAADVARFNFGQQAPWDLLGRYSQLVSGNYGGTSSGTNTQDLYRNRAAGVLGGGMAGASAGSVFGPWGTAIGALLGGAGGYF